MTVAIGIDIGGTRIKAIACEPDTSSGLYHHSESTGDGEFSDGMPIWASRVRSLLTTIEEKLGQPAAYVGISAPGIPSRTGDSIAFLPVRMQGLEGWNWTAYLRRERTIPVINDAQAALLGEVWRGAARGLRHVLLITLGTGVGGAVWADGRLLQGANHRAGHLGHICLDWRGSADITGAPGSLEDAIGEATLPIRSRGRYHSTQELIADASQGNPFARQVWHDSIQALGCGLTSLINAFDPEAIVLGGGIAQSGPALLEPLKEVLDRVEWRPEGIRVSLLQAQLGEWAGAWGAAWHALREGRKL